MLSWDYLRDYQKKLVLGASNAFQHHDRVLIQSGTGSGKTVTSAYIAKRIEDSGHRVTFVVHRRELLRQTIDAYQNVGLKVEELTGTNYPRAPITVAMVETLANRLERDPLPAPKYIIVDECHRSVADTYLRVFRCWPSSRVLGLTATPCRTDGRGLGEVYQGIVQGPPVRDLIKQGALCDYELFAPSAHHAEDAEEGRLIGDAVEHHQRLLSDRLTVIMTSTVREAERIAQLYRLSNIRAAAIHSELDEDARDAMLADFRSGKLSVLVSVDLLVEGIDIPEISAVQLLSKTESLSKYLQIVGRMLRPHTSKHGALLLDHRGNWLQHGIPCADREWGLTGKTGKVKDPEDALVGIATCDECFFVYRVHLDRCPDCGHTNEEKKRRRAAQIEAELELKEKEEAERERVEIRRQQGRAQSIEELAKVGLEQGRKWAWAAFVFASRDRQNRGRKPTREEYGEARKWRKHWEELGVKP